MCGYCKECRRPVATVNKLIPGIGAIPMKAVKPGGSRGFTLLELIVAMALCAFALSLVFYSWNYISNHTIVQQRRSLFQAESDRIAQSIAAEMRKSPEVISLSTNRVTMLAANGADTVTFEYSNGVLLKNNAPVSCLLAGGRVTQFLIEKEGAAESNPASTYATITLTFRMENNFGDVSQIPLKIRVALPQNPADEALRQWNF
jgi:prepilin-type N-terminal cleavage/methylation domain-containing protein